MPYAGRAECGTSKGMSKDEIGKPELRLCAICAHRLRHEYSRANKEWRWLCRKCLGVMEQPARVAVLQELSWVLRNDWRTALAIQVGLSDAAMAEIQKALGVNAQAPDPPFE